MSQVRLATAAVMAATLLATACTPTSQPTPTPTATPSPTFSCTTSTIADPCTAEKAAKEKEQAVAVASSTLAYTSFLAEYIRVTREGGAPEATSAMKQFAEGPFLTEYTGYVENTYRKHWRYSGDISSRYFRPLTAEHRSDAPSTEMTFAFCQDGTNNLVTDSSGSVIGHGSLIAGKIYVRPSGQTWKLYETDNSRVTSC